MSQPICTEFECTPEDCPHWQWGNCLIECKVPADYAPPALPLPDAESMESPAGETLMEAMEGLLKKRMTPEARKLVTAAIKAQRNQSTTDSTDKHRLL